MLVMIFAYVSDDSNKLVMILFLFFSFFSFPFKFINLRKYFCCDNNLLFFLAIIYALVIIYAIIYVLDIIIIIITLSLSPSLRSL